MSIYMTPTPPSATILIVDDTPSNLGMAVTLLEGRGYRVAIAQDGEEGIERAQLLRPDLILLDVMMPGADGFEICRRLKTSKETHDIPVIFMTALASSEDKVKGFAAGGVDYVTKPLQIDEVLARVDTHVKLHAAHLRLEQQHAQLQAYQENLERRVAERTLALSSANRQLQVEVEKQRQTELALEESRSQLRSLAARYQENSEEERKLMAHELHEDLAQILSGLQLKLAALGYQLGADVAALRKPLDEAGGLTEKAIAIVRNISAMLRPSVVEMGVAETLEWLAERFKASTQINCGVHILENGTVFTERQAIVLFRIVQESLSNVAQHAQASRVDITLERDSTTAILCIRDNGCGFDTRHNTSKALGLLGMQERALTLGGSVDIESSVGQGSVVMVRIPVPGALD
jgi:signal transduction histidine kinase